MTTSTIGCEELFEFKRQWPYRGFPDQLATIVFEFDPRGGLLDVEARDVQGRALDSAAIDESTVAALTRNAQSRLCHVCNGTGFIETKIPTNRRHGSEPADIRVRCWLCGDLLST